MLSMANDLNQYILADICKDDVHIYFFIYCGGDYDHDQNYMICDAITSTHQHSKNESFEIIRTNQLVSKRKLFQ